MGSFGSCNPVNVSSRLSLVRYFSTSFLLYLLLIKNNNNNKREVHWATHFSGLLNDSEVVMVEYFVLSLQGRSVYKEEEDKVIYAR